MSAPEIIDGEAQEFETEETTHELTVAPAAPATLFRTDDPVLVAQRASEVADALKDILKRQNLTTNIGGREHVRVEGWQTLGAMLGITPVCVWTRQIPKGWEARVEARTLDGRVIGAAEAMCTREERTWKNRDDYALRSMAQTRATSKALGSPLRFVVTLAGYDGTPAEEIPTQRAPEPQAPPHEKPKEAIDAERVNELGQAIGAHKLTYADINALLGACGIDGLRAASGKALKERLETLTPEQADALFAELGDSDE
jgi:hypothetical protein